MSDSLQDVMEERARQDAKCGVQNHRDEWWLTILIEEVGEAAEAILENSDATRNQHLSQELVSVAAVAVAWLEAIQRRNA